MGKIHPEPRLLKKWPGTSALYNSFADNHSHADIQNNRRIILLLYNRTRQLVSSNLHPKTSLSIKYLHVMKQTKRRSYLSVVERSKATDISQPHSTFSSGFPNIDIPNISEVKYHSAVILNIKSWSTAQPIKFENKN